MGVLEIVYDANEAKSKDEKETVGDRLVKWMNGEFNETVNYEDVGTAMQAYYMGPNDEFRIPKTVARVEPKHNRRLAFDDSSQFGLQIIVLLAMLFFAYFVVR